MHSGYMAPEYLNKGFISTKSDIFSLGVIITELLIGSREYPQTSEESFAHFIENVLEKWRNRLSKTSEYNTPLEREIQQISSCTVMGLRCVDPDPEKRPAVWDIIEMLDATTEIYVLHAGSEQLHHSGPSFDLFSSSLMAPAPSSSLRASVLPYKTANVRDYYRIGKKLGQGHSGTTYRCVRKADGAQYACKSIPKRKLLCREDYEDVYREIQIMHRLSDHPNVTHIQGTYEDALFVHIVMELCAGGDLLDRIVSKQQGRYSERAAAELIRKIIGVVDGCHSLGVIHGNLKPDNLLFDSDSEDATLKLTGFEFSVFYMPGDKFSRIIQNSYYVAPEVLQESYGPEADIWSVGVILYILLSGVHPFWGETEEGSSSEILHDKLDFESDPWPSISDSAKDLIRNMLTWDPIKKFSAHEVLCHPWIIDDAVAPDKPTDSAVLSRLKHYSAMNMFTKMVSKVTAESMSEEEIGGLKMLFKKLDTDNSGNITFDELKDGLKRLSPALSDTEIQMLMDAVDIDNSGTIDCAEFVAATLHMNKREREENLSRAFSFFDQDGNGYITTDNLSEACRDFGVDVVHLEDMIKDIDQNNDGKIDYSEFVAMMRKGNAGEP
ncbi:unnamed protein product [Urochloa decumbens]|uniref:non-specific serine/threonine protein kinase n=1 Tax=Urochloa decumbens TaxID=240449 RepID=A0ABC9B9Y3_9POAL